MRLWIVAALLLAAAVGQAEEPFDSTFERLAKVDQFAFGPTGYAAVISQGEKDYQVILSRPSAIADFERLFSVGNLQAKCYALVGLRTLNRKRFYELSHSLRDSKEEVVTQKGCIIFHKPLTDVLKRIEAGEYSMGK
ncbi:MAG TPA: hypothetical protein VF845_09395 [Terriglobales bacterium]